MRVRTSVHFHDISAYPITDEVDEDDENVHAFEISDDKIDVKRESIPCLFQRLITFSGRQETMQRA